METIFGRVIMEEFMECIFYFLDVEIGDSILINEDKFTDVREYFGKKVECKVMVWDCTKTRYSEKYRVIGVVK